MSKKGTPLWREAHFEVKRVKNWRVRSTLGSWDVQKVHAVVARSTFQSQTVQYTSAWALLEVQMSKKCTPWWHEAHFKVRVLKTPHVRATFGRWSVVLCCRRKGFCTLPKVSKTWKFCSISKNDGRCRTFEEDLQRWISRGRRSTRDMFIRDVERGCILEHQIFRFAKMMLRDRFITSYEPASLFRGRRSTLNRWNGKIAMRIGTKPSALPSTFHFWSLAELLHFWCCQLEKLRKSRRIASILTSSSSKIEEVSQNSFVFKLVDRQIDKHIDRSIDR